MKYLKKGNYILDHCEEALSAIAMFSMCIIVFVAVVCRRFLELPFPASEEIARYLMVWVIYIGVSIGVRKKAHIGVDVFINMLPRKITKLFLILGQLITIATFVCLFVLAIQWIQMSMGPNPQLTPLTRLPYWYMYLSLGMGFGLSVLRSIQVFFNDFILKSEGIKQTGGGQDA